MGNTVMTILTRLGAKPNFQDFLNQTFVRSKTLEQKLIVNIKICSSHKISYLWIKYTSKRVVILRLRSFTICVAIRFILAAGVPRKNRQS